MPMVNYFSNVPNAAYIKLKIISPLKKKTIWLELKTQKINNLSSLSSDDLYIALQSTGQ